MRSVVIVLTAGLLVSSPGAAVDLGFGASLENHFAEITPKGPPQEYVGTWTGSAGPYLMTLRLGEDGRGLYCYSWHTRDVVGNMKFDGELLRFQDGGKLKVRRDGALLMTEFEDPSLPSYRLVQDPKLVEASPYCKKAVG